MCLQILGNNEAFEPITSNLYTRRVLAGDFFVINKYMVRDLMGLGLWTADMRNAIMAGRGSIQDIPGIPEELKALYKTAWELSMKVLIDMARDRGAFIDQSQSLNLFMGGTCGGVLFRWPPLRHHVHRMLVRALRPSPHAAEVDVHAHVRLEAGPQDGHVLPADPAQGRRHSVYRGQGRHRLHIAPPKWYGHCSCSCMPLRVRVVAVCRAAPS